MTSHVAQADPVRGKWLLWRACCNKETVPHWGSIVNPSAFSDLPSLPAPCKGPCCAGVQGARPSLNPEHVLLLAPHPSPQFFLMPLIASALVLSFLSGAGVALAVQVCVYHVVAGSGGRVRGVFHGAGEWCWTCVEGGEAGAVFVHGKPLDGEIRGRVSGCGNHGYGALCFQQVPSLPLVPRESSPLG